MATPQNETKSEAKSHSKEKRPNGLESPLGPSPLAPETDKKNKPTPTSDSQPYVAPGDTV